MKHYAHFDLREFLIALGYRGEAIKRYFLDYSRLNGNMTVSLSSGTVQTHNQEPQDWLVHLIETGGQTNTGGRVRRLERWLNDEAFMLTYGDGVSDINLRELLRFHRRRGRLATVTAVRPPARFGGLILDGELVGQFSEKPQIGEGWINGGFFVFEPGIFDYFEGDDTSLERDALEQLAAEGQLAAYRHEGFWQCMDTLRDVRSLENMWQGGDAPWKLWKR